MDQVPLPALMEQVAGAAESMPGQAATCKLDGGAPRRHGPGRILDKLGRELL